MSGNYLKLRVHERIYANNGSIPTVAMELLSKELLTFQKLLQLPNLHPNLRLQLFVLIKKKNNASNTGLWKSWWRCGDWGDLEILVSGCLAKYNYNAGKPFWTKQWCTIVRTCIIVQSKKYGYHKGRKKSSRYDNVQKLHMSIQGLATSMW